MSWPSNYPRTLHADTWDSRKENDGVTRKIKSVEGLFADFVLELMRRAVALRRQEEALRKREAEERRRAQERAQVPKDIQEEEEKLEQLGAARAPSALHE